VETKTTRENHGIRKNNNNRPWLDARQSVRVGGASQSDQFVYACGSSPHWRVKKKKKNTRRRHRCYVSLFLLFERWRRGQLVRLPPPHLLPYSTGQTEMKTVTQRLPPHPAVSLSYFNHHLNSYRVAWSSLEHLPSVDFDGWLLAGQDKQRENSISPAQ
jgi:hypothetical protein